MNDQDLTIRERRALKAYLNGGTNADVALAYGSKAKNPANIGIMLIRRLKDKVVLTDLLEEAGVTDELIFRKLREGMDATEVKIATDHGIISDERVYTDFSTRKGYIELAAKLKGHLKEKVDHQVTGDFTFKVKGRDDSPVQIEGRGAPGELGPET